MKRYLQRFSLGGLKSQHETISRTIVQKNNVSFTMKCRNRSNYTETFFFYNMIFEIINYDIIHVSYIHIHFFFNIMLYE